MNESLVLNTIDFFTTEYFFISIVLFSYITDYIKFYLSKGYRSQIFNLFPKYIDRTKYYKISMVPCKQSFAPTICFSTSQIEILNMLWIEKNYIQAVDVRKN